MSSKLSMPCCSTVLSPPMYTINGGEQSWKPTGCVLLQQPSRVLSIGCSHPLPSGHRQDLQEFDMPRCECLGYLLVGAMSKHSGITPLLEEVVMEVQTFCNVLEQINRHPELAEKVSLGIHWMVNKIVEHELGVLIDSLPSNVLTAQTEPPWFGLLFLCINIIAMSSSSISSSSSDSEYLNKTIYN